MKVAIVHLAFLVAVSSMLPYHGAAQSPQIVRVSQAMELRKFGNPGAAIAILEPIASGYHGDAPSEEQGITWNALGSSYQDLEKYQEARSCYERSIESLRSIPSAQPTLALAMNNLGSVELEMGRVKDSERLTKRSRKLYTQIFDHAGIARASMNLAILEFERGNMAATRRSILDAVRESKRASKFDDDDLSALLSLQGRIALVDNLPEAASAFFSQAIDHWVRLHGAGSYLVGIGLLLRAQAYSANGDFTHALLDIGQALSIFAISPGQQTALYWRATFQKAQVIRRQGAVDEAGVLEKRATTELKNIESRRCGECTVTVQALR